MAPPQTHRSTNQLAPVANDSSTSNPLENTIMASLINPQTLRAARASCPYLSSTPSQQLRSLATSSVGGANALALRAIGCPIMAKAMALCTVEGIKRTYASQAPREEVDAIHRQLGVQPGTQGVCPASVEGFVAPTQASDKAADPLKYAAPTQQSFDYEAFYKAELDKKHKDKSYRCATLLLMYSSLS